MSVNVQVLNRKSDARGPFLANFEQNIPPSEEFSDSISIELKEKNRKKTMLRMSNEVIEISGKGTSCSASESSGSSSDSKKSSALSSSSYLIGIKDDATNTLKLFSVEQLFKLQQHTRKDLDRVSKIDSNIAKTKTSHMEQKQMLVAEFGTVKSRKKVKQMQNNIVHEQNLSSNLKESLQERGSELEEEALTYTEKERDQEIESKRDFLPEFDLEAKVPSEIYELRSVITPEDLQSLSFAAEYIKKRDLLKSESQNMTYFARNLLFGFQETFGGRNNGQLIAKQIVYLDYLLRVANKVKLSGTNLESIAAETNIPAPLIKNILKNFYQAFQSSNSVVYQRSTQLKDKLISYIIVLALIIFDFKFEAGPLAQILRIEPKRFLNYAKEVGCSVKIKENADVTAKNAHQINIELKAPLKLQKPKTASKKGGK